VGNGRGKGKGKGGHIKRGIGGNFRGSCKPVHNQGNIA
jgi:hypothetical protein